MEYPKPGATPEEQIAHWDVQRTLCIDGLVYATSQRIACSKALNEQRHEQPAEFAEPFGSIPADDHTSDPAFQESFVQ